MCYHKSSCLCSIDIKEILDYMSYEKHTKNNFQRKKLNILKHKRFAQLFQNIGGINYLL